MRFNIQNWVEQVKSRPEHIRHRYLIGCVAVSMFFVVTIWSLTITENFKKSSPVKSAEKNSNILPKTSDFSLDSILSGDGTIQDKPSKSGEDFLRQQEENRSRLDPEYEGIKPKESETGEEGATDNPSNIVMPTLP